MRWIGTVAWCLMATISMAQQQKPVDSLMARVLHQLAPHKGYFAVAFKDPASGQTLLINEHEIFHAASTMKTPVMIEAYRQAAAGKCSLHDSLPVHNSFKSIVDSSVFSLDSTDDSEHTLYVKTGTRMTLYDLVYAMIIRSSNLATNLVIEQVGAAQVTQTMRRMGAQQIEVLRGVEDNKAFQQGLNNKVTAYDLMLLFEQLAAGRAVSAAASRDMINILLHQEFNEVIPALLPAGVKVAHKTGSITSVNHDGGIVFLPDGRKYILVLLSRGWDQEADAVQAMAGVSKLVYDWMMGE